MKYYRGTTRFVLVVGRYVFKFPIFWRGSQVFWDALLGNYEESHLYFKKRDSRLCKIYFSFFSLFMICERVITNYDMDLSHLSDKMLEQYFRGLPLDLLGDGNWGIVNRKGQEVLVLTDYEYSWLYDFQLSTSKDE